MITNTCLIAGNFEPELPPAGVEASPFAPPDAEPLELEGVELPVLLAGAGVLAASGPAGASGVASGETAGGSPAELVDSLGPESPDEAGGSTSFRCGRADAASE